MMREWCAELERKLIAVTDQLKAARAEADAMADRLNELLAEARAEGWREGMKAGMDASKGMGKGYEQVIHALSSTLTKAGKILEEGYQGKEPTHPDFSPAWQAYEVIRDFFEADWPSEDWPDLEGIKKETRIETLKEIKEMLLDWGGRATMPNKTALWVVIRTLEDKIKVLNQAPPASRSGKD